VLSELFEKVSKCQFRKTDDFFKIKEGRDRLKNELQKCNEKEKLIQDKKQELLEIADRLNDDSEKISQLQALETEPLIIFMKLIIFNLAQVPWTYSVKIHQIQEEMQKRKALLDDVQKQLVNYQEEIDIVHKIINKTVQEMRQICSRFDYVKEIESTIILLEEQIELCLAEMSTDPKKDKELASYQEVKKNMMSLLKGVQKHTTV
jgi:chromosome segregation ATPase